MTKGDFSRASIPGVDDAERLAAWDSTRDPRRIVLPLAVAAAWSYSSPTTFAEVMQRRGLGDSAPAAALAVDNEAMFVCARAYVQKVGDGAVLTFRGTPPTNVVNWLADATMQKVAFHTKNGVTDRGWVHGGFYRNARAIWPEVVEAFDELDPKWIYITGHSFGGALAVLAAALLADYEHDKKDHRFGRLWQRVRGIVTFGQPMVGDEAFAARYDASVGKRLFRFVYSHDIVPHLPPNTFGWDPVHFGAELRGKDETKWTNAAGPSRPVGALGALGSAFGIGAWAKDQVGLLPRMPLPYSWADHAPNNYIRVSLPKGVASGSEFD